VLAQWWRESAELKGTVPTFREFWRNLGEFLYESMPEQRRQRYGDAEYDWEYRADTTSATVGWRERLIGKFTSPYQPTDPELFHQMLSSLHLDYRDFIFLDLGSGKGRTLLMASDYPFRRIIGLELLPGLAEVAARNIRDYKSDTQQCFAIESVCADAREFEFPLEPTLLYLFNPLPEAALREVMARLAKSVRAHPRAVVVLYHNPLLRDVVVEASGVEEVLLTEQYGVWRWERGGRQT
jgi:SAM-dependent methyltransferase